MHKTVSVSEVFKPAARGKAKYTRKYIREHPGGYPVFSASTTGPVGWIDSFDYDGDYLTWSTNGYAGRTMVLNGRFSSTSDRAMLESRHEGISLEYCAIVLAPKFELAARGRRQAGPRRNEYTKLPPEEATQIEFEIPVTKDDEFDLDAQLAFVKRWRTATEFQRDAAGLVEVLDRAIVLPQFGEDVQTAEISLMDEKVFTFLKKETGWGKKDWVNLNTQDPNHYPVFSAAKSAVAFVEVETEKLIHASTDAPVLSFAVDGDGSAGTNFVFHRTPFYVSTNRATFRSVRDDVDLEFVYFSLQTMKVDHGFGYNYKAYPAHLQAVKISLPLTVDGRYNIDAQASIVERLRALYEMRFQVTQSLAQVARAQISFA